MICQTIPGSEKTMDEFCNQPIREVAAKCLQSLGDLDRTQVLNAFDSDPEGFKVALADTFQRFSDERNAQRLRHAMGTMSQESLLTTQAHSNNQRTLRDIDEELQDRKVRDRIVAAAVRAIENNTRSSWDHDLLESDKDHILCKRCEQYVLHGKDFLFDPTRKPSLYYSPTVEYFMKKCAQPIPCAEEACMDRVKNAKQPAMVS